LPVEETFQSVFAFDVTLGDGDIPDRRNHTIENLSTGKRRRKPHGQERK
jgi:hypothetical protein